VAARLLSGKGESAINQKDRWMKFKFCQRSAPYRAEEGLTLIDALFAMAIAGVMFTALYAGLAFGFNVIKMARENTRATQIMLEKMESIRLYTWSQVNSNGFISTNKFVVPYYAVGGTNSSLVYTGQVMISPSGLTNTYADDMRKVTVRVEWKSIGVSNRVKTMTTYVANRGLQSYVY
jgi:hypothetical protein